MVFRLSYEDIVNRIVTEKGVLREEVEQKIQSKLSILGELISKQGAAHIVANEFGIKLFFDNTPKELKIDRIVPGLNFISINVKVISSYDKREFKTDKRQGVVLNTLVGDESGVARLVVWDTNIINKLSEVKEGDILSIKNAYCRSNNGFFELHLGTRGEVVINPSGVVIGEINYNKGRNLSRKNIAELRENDNSEIAGTLVQLFEPRFYNSCPVCNKKVDVSLDGFSCGIHGVVEPKEAPVVNFFFDDGTDNIRVVCFRENAYSILSKSDIALIKENPGSFESIKENVMGKQLIIRGKVTKNAMFDRLEFSASSIEELNPSVVIEELEK